MVYLKESSMLFSCHPDWEQDRGEEVLLNLLGCYCESLTLGGIKPEIIFSHRFLNTSLPLTTVPISIPTPPWKPGLNTHNPLPAPDTPPCNPPSTFKHICHFSCLLYPFFSGPGYKSQKTSRAASVYRAPSASTAQYCVNTTNYLKTEENGVFSIKPLISKNADTAREEQKRCPQVLIKPETHREAYAFLCKSTPDASHICWNGCRFPTVCRINVFN